ncbi:hypothetical protein GTR02_07170 [Kineococcus sp. R8]|uniref:hypothetical protein n=1 Tax=Kineococcus siccus TaxID=2696567 RepID=UPI001412C478|nr:hypothetical protein [Kineococcus siccus]NAZ81596.1 hypothetical protein [Kineococcus siccus]
MTSSLPRPAVHDDDRALPAELRVLLTCGALVVAVLLCRLTGLAASGALLLFVVLTVVSSVGLPWRAAVLVAASAWAVHTGFVVGRFGVLDLSADRLVELALFLGAASVSWLAGRGAHRARGTTTDARHPGEG